MKLWCRRMQLLILLSCFSLANTVCCHLSSVKVRHFMVGWFSLELVPHPLTSLESLTAAFLYQQPALVSATFHDCQNDLPHYLSVPFRNGILERAKVEQCWRHLFPVVPNSECMKAPMSLMWGLLHFTSIWKWRWMVVVCRQNKRTAACMGLTEVGPSRALKAPLDLCILYFPDNFANEIIKPCVFFIQICSNFLPFC